MVGSSQPPNFGDAVFVVTWLLFCTTTLSVGTRIGTRIYLSRKLEKDDITAIISLLFSLGHAITVAQLVSNGLGREIWSLSWDQIVAFQKSIYAANFLYLATLWTSKVSVLFLVIQLTPDHLHKRWAYAGIGILSLWFVTSIFVTAFQCSMPNPWQVVDNKCINLLAFWDYVLIFNIFSDAVLIILPVYIISAVHIETRRKIAICGCFAARVLTMVCSILELIYSQHSFTSVDPTKDMGTLIMCTVFTQNLSLVTACVPYLKPFYLGLGSGMIRSDDLRRAGRVGFYGYGTGKSNNHSLGGTSGSPPGTKHEANMTMTGYSNRSPKYTSPNYFDNLTHTGSVGQNNTTIEADGRIELGDWDRGSHGSSGSQSRIILQTTTWTVES